MTNDVPWYSSFEGICFEIDQRTPVFCLREFIHTIQAKVFVGCNFESDAYMELSGLVVSHMFLFCLYNLSYGVGIGALLSNLSVLCVVRTAYNLYLNF